MAFLPWSAVMHSNLAILCPSIARLGPSKLLQIRRLWLVARGGGNVYSREGIEVEDSGFQPLTYGQVT